jgi:hypothetical protein
VSAGLQACFLRMSRPEGRCGNALETVTCGGGPAGGRAAAAALTDQARM